MDRRKFIKNSVLAGGASLLLNNIPVNALAKNKFLQRLAGVDCNDRVVVLIQLHGGNDGLNTLVPLDQYSIYQSVRPNIALPKSGASRVLTNLDSTLSNADQVGIHPDLNSLKTMYDNGMVNAVQSVAYDGLNQSHFRSRDIWFMGGDNDEYLDSGWMGRYLDHRYPGYPDAYPNSGMLDPLALEIGNGISLAFHTPTSIPAGLAIQDPQAFHSLIDGVVGADGLPPGLLGSSAEPPTAIETTNYADELRWIMEFELKSDQYAERLRDVYLAGSNSAVNYPETYPFNAPQQYLKNHLAGQLKLVSRLLKGGVQTRVFLARIGGFDTHAQQVESHDTTLGAHSALLYNLFGAIKAFHDDLEAMGLGERVLTMTFSEFGRRVASNGSFGTDHGSSAPMFVFGKNVNPGVTGTNPSLTDLDRGNLKFQHDYRQVFGAVMEDWMTCGDQSAMDAVGFDSDASSPKLDLISSDVTATKEAFVDRRFALYNVSPNPVEKSAIFSYRINRDDNVSLRLLDNNGKVVLAIDEGFRTAGKHEVKVDLSHLSKGIYFYKLRLKDFSDAKKLVKS